MSALLKTFSKNVTTAGTRVALSASGLQVREVFIQAKSANTGYIYLGFSDVASSNGIQLDAGGSFSIGESMIPRTGNVMNLADLYIDSSVNGEGVIVGYLTR